MFLSLCIALAACSTRCAVLEQFLPLLGTTFHSMVPRCASHCNRHCNRLFGISLATFCASGLVTISVLRAFSQRVHFCAARYLVVCSKKAFSIFDFCPPSRCILIVCNSVHSSDFFRHRAWSWADRYSLGRKSSCSSAIPLF